MKGHICKRSKDSWSIIIDIGRDPYTGKRRQQWHTVRGTKKDAERALRDMLLSFDQGTYVKPSRINVGEWLTQWCDTYVAMHTTIRTQESYKSIVDRHLIPSLGAIPLSELRPQHLQNHYAQALSQGRKDKKGGLSARTVLYQHRILSEALSHAVKMGLLARNVAEVVDPPRPSRPKMATLAPEDIHKYLEAASETPYYVFFSALLYTGLRRGELLALKWKNVDLDMATLYVVETAYKLNDGTYVIKEPKTPHSRRGVSLPPSLALLLRQHRSDQEVMFGQSDKDLTDADFVFTRPDGSPLNPNAITLAHAKILEKAGLPHVRVHDLRHTHATLMLKAGVHPKVVSERLGHANISITLDTYTHVLPGLQEAAAERFDGLLEQEMSNAAEDKNVSKLLAKEADLDSEPSGIRTPDTLIKSQVLFP